MEVFDVNLSIRLVLAGVFLMAGLLKLTRANRMEVVNVLHAAGLRHPVLTRAAGIPLALFELVLGSMILTEDFANSALAITALLLVVFIVFLLTAIGRGYSGSCSCFGPWRGPVDGSAVFFDMSLVALSLVALFAFDDVKRVRDVSVFELLAGGGIALWLLAVKMLTHEVVAVRQRLLSLRNRTG